MTNRLLTPLKVIKLSTESMALAPVETTLSVEKVEDDRYATVRVETMGADLMQALRKTLHLLDSDGIITVHLYLPADQPLPAELDAELFKLELFYSGIVPRTMQRWELVYTLLQGQHFDFSAIALHEEDAQALRDYMQAQYLLVKEHA